MFDTARHGASVQVQLSVRSGHEAVAFYKHAFGATEIYRFENNDEVVAQLAIGTTIFWVEDESPEHDNYSPETLGGATARLLIVAGDPGAVVEAAVTAGAREVYPLEEAHGWLLGRVVDPFGHHWEIGRPPSPWPPHMDEQSVGR